MNPEQREIEAKAAGKGQAYVVPRTPAPRAWNLASLRAVRKRLTGEVKAYAELATPTRVETERFRALTFAYSILAGILKDEKASDIEDRLAELEKAVEKVQTHGGALGPGWREEA
jgi:hypothetical protein